MEVSFGRLSLPVHGSFHVQSQPNIQNNVLMARKKLENINCI